MNVTDVLFIAVTFIAFSAFLGLIILAILLGFQIKNGKDLEDKLKDALETNQRLQINLDLMSGILSGWLKVEQRNLPVDARRREISDLLSQLNGMHGGGVTMSGGTMNVGNDLLGGNKTT